MHEHEPEACSQNKISKEKWDCKFEDEDTNWWYFHRMISKLRYFFSLQLRYNVFNNVHTSLDEE